MTPYDYSREIYNALRKPPFNERESKWDYYTESDWVDYPEEDEDGLVQRDTDI